ncbi:AraC family transcriptional regulator [Latilactobacillus fuchuensis]|uniref:AraC family transcriptional regulator n=1 Tax=Latilactobacillus fuchuensis TaxID=164393 RepID=UPI0039AFEE25
MTSSVLKKLPVVDTNIRFFGAHRQTVGPHWHFKEEVHHAFEIIYIISGIQRTTINGQYYDLPANTFLLLPPGIRHTNESLGDQKMTYFCAHFDIDEPILRLTMINHTDNIYDQTSPYYSDLIDVIEKMMLLLQVEHYTISNKLQIQIYVIQLLQVFAHMFSLSTDHQKFSESTMTYAREIADAIKWDFKKMAIDEQDNYEPISIQDIIRSLGISPGYGLEIFHKVYAMSPQSYLASLKYNEAKILLQQPNLSMLSVARRCGYKNLSHFSRQFKRWSGMNPSEYHRQNRSIN